MSAALSSRHGDAVAAIPHTRTGTAVPTRVGAILAATRQVIAARGPEKFTMSAVAAAAGVSRPTLYRWFPTKDALLEALRAYEGNLFDARLQAVVASTRSPQRRLDAALRFLVTYLDGLMGPDPIGADPRFALRSLGNALAPRTASLERLLGDALDVVPAVRQGRLTRAEAAELFLRLAYSHYLIPHPDPEALLANLRSLCALPRRSITTATG